MELTASLFGEPAIQFMVTREFAYRQETAESHGPREHLESAARTLELNLVVATLLESMVELRIATFADVFRRMEEIVDRAAMLARLDLKRVLGENADLLPPPPANFAASAPVGANMPEVARNARSLLVHCRIEELERQADDAGLGALGHRCRIAYDGLQALVLRSDPERNPLRVIGVAYADGRLSLDEVATLLELDRSDAVAALEEHGYCRPLHVVALTEEERADRLRDIRAERIARRGGPPGTALVRRDVLATQRIEGVDARPWLPRT